MRLDDKAIVVPAFSDKGKPLVLEMETIYKAEARLVELSFVSKERAGELLHNFITAWSLSSRHAGVIHEHWVRAKQNLRYIRAQIVLDEAPEELRKRGLSTTKAPGGSEDLRNSVVDRSDSYQEAFNRLAEIEATLKYVEVKAETFKMAYFSVNKLLDGTARQNSISGGAGDDDVGALTPEEKIQQRTPSTADYGSSFGKVSV